ncbi:hypothetical protein HCU73_03255 [Roseibacterium sp. KMU-115]|uniref:Uncharacterized protein n=2 Tax=Roseicyclus persicicus TaxID=2650661 RepID=A0A7X6GWB0_9RHOB|nr:hypothetical protein [Roseibacterium persicicum]
MDGRTALAAEMRARWQELTDDLGGADRMSYAKRSLCERALWLEHWIREAERALAEGRPEDFDVSRWVYASNSLQGIFAKLGLDRVARDVTDLREYMAKAKAGGDG